MGIKLNTIPIVVSSHTLVPGKVHAEASGTDENAI
jgi:hypothetical protein